MTLVPHLPPRLSALEPFVAANVFDSTAVRFVDALYDTFGPLNLPEMLAAALAARAPAHQHVCVDLSDLATQLDTRSPAASDPDVVLPWPDHTEWTARLKRSSLVGHGPGTHNSVAPLALVDGRVYLTRLDRQESAVAEAIGSRVSGPGDAEPSPIALDIAEHIFGAGGTGDELQRQAALKALTHRFLVVAGGPGTGKTRTIAAALTMIAADAHGSGTAVDIALAAPTGKAAARLNEAIRAQLGGVRDPNVDGPLLPAGASDALADVSGSTLHRLLGAHPDGTWRHHSANPLPHDLVIVDEVSMVALPLMARLFDALRDDARLVLVGDPFQLASVEAGTVLADIVGPQRDSPLDAAQARPDLARSIVVLRTNHRFDADSAVGRAAGSILERDAASTLEALGERPSLHDALDLAIDHAVDVADAAEAGNVADALSRVGRLGFLCGSWKGDGGVDAVNESIATALARRTGRLGGWASLGVGSVVMVTHNNPSIGLYNGDIGVAVLHEGSPRVAFEGPDGPRLFPRHVLGETRPAWAITVHRSQGSEYDRVIVSLPDAPSLLLTRELLYTAVTRARTSVAVVGSDTAIADAVSRDVNRASGLAARLWS